MDDSTEDCSDMIHLPEINELTINANLRVRYNKDKIYTYTGTILVAVNPYKELHIYDEAFIQKYSTNQMSQLEPHVFAVAQAAYYELRNNMKNQACVISGESGAGKTESTKFILQFLCAVSSAQNQGSSWIQQQILEANTILEAFGNAKTVRNDNSSRFGKFFQVCFDQRYEVKGCVVQDYLLEQSRITLVSPLERNYHVFYELVAAGRASCEFSQQFFLEECFHYKYLNAGVESIDGVDDASMFDALRLALSVLGIGQDLMDGMFSTLSAILWLGNIEFVESGSEDESSRLSDDDGKVLSKVASLLGLATEQLSYIILHRQIIVRGNVTEIPFKLAEAQQNRHALAKALYSRCFAWVIDFINRCTNPRPSASRSPRHSSDSSNPAGNVNTDNVIDDSAVHRFLGVLDIFGFEDFGAEKNSFEQLCINYTNEKLHKFFNHYVFSLEQQTYQLEGITYKHVDFVDNSSCLELIEKPPKGILRLLVEECRMPKGSDQSFVSKLHAELSDHPHYVKGDDRRRWESEFGIRHYAGSVMYAARGFLEKNKDAQVDALFELMHNATNTFVRDLVRFRDLVEVTLQRSSENQIGSVLELNASSSFGGSCAGSGVSVGSTGSGGPSSSGGGKGSLGAASGATMSRTMSKAKPTVADAFRQQLTALVDVLHMTQPWYVRCIKPNTCKQPNFFDQGLVMDQLKYLGMLEIINIRRMGYPTHIEHSDFVAKYRCLLGPERRAIKRGQDSVDSSRLILNMLEIKEIDWQIGRTKIFLRSSASNVLEEMRKSVLNQSAIVLQRVYRGWKCRKEYLKKKDAACTVQQYYRARREKIRFINMRRAAVVVQAYVRGMFAREVASALRERRKVEEALEHERSCQEKIAQSKELQEAEEIIKAAQEELAVITEMMQLKRAGQKLSAIEEEHKQRIAAEELVDNADRKMVAVVTSPNGVSGGVQAELDQMFSFLSEVQQTPVDEKQAIGADTVGGALSQTHDGAFNEVVKKSDAQNDKENVQLPEAAVPAALRTVENIASGAAVVSENENCDPVALPYGKTSHESDNSNLHTLVKVSRDAQFNSQGIENVACPDEPLSELPKLEQGTQNGDTAQMPQGHQRQKVDVSPIFVQNDSEQQRPATPIKPEDTDSECDGEDEGEQEASPPPPPPMPPQGLGALHAQQAISAKQLPKQSITPVPLISSLPPFNQPIKKGTVAEASHRKVADDKSADSASAEGIVAQANQQQFDQLSHQRQELLQHEICHGQTLPQQQQLATSQKATQAAHLSLQMSDRKSQVNVVGVLSASTVVATAPLTPIKATMQTSLQQQQQETTPLLLPSSNFSNPPSGSENVAEREQRRRQRVEKKLSEMQREDQQLQENRRTSRLENGAAASPVNASGNGVVDGIGDLGCPPALSMFEFAQLHFARHPKEFYQGSQTTQAVMRTLTRRRRSSAHGAASCGADMHALPIEEMITFCKQTIIPGPHLSSVCDAEHAQLSVSTFKDLCKLVRGEMNNDGEVLFIQTACQLAIEHEVLRDEFLVQACRQATGNPLGPDAVRRCWLYLTACLGCFKPSKTFYKFLVAFIRERTRDETGDPEVRSFAHFALAELSAGSANAVGRRCPPSQHEIDAVRRREPLLCRLYLMDGRSKTVEVSASTTVAQASRALADKIGLKNTDGWTIFEHNPERRQALKSYEYIADVIFQWEQHRRSSAQLTKNSSISKKTLGLAVGAGDCRFLFKKRLFKAIREIPQDPVEVDLLYAQAVHDVVSMDYYPVAERVALQLAGLQARVILGEPEQSALTPEDNLEKFGKNLAGYLPRRVRDRRSELEFSQAIAAAYRAYGKGKSELVCKVWYLSIVMQYPLYGTTLYPVKCRGFLTYDNQMLLGISAEGVLLVNAETKCILNAYRYNEMESVRVASDEDSITFTLPKDVPDIHKCYMFETKEKMDIANLISAYAPSIASWLKPTYEVNVKTRLAFEDRMKLHQEVLKCRKNVVDTGLLNKPVDQESSNIFKNTLRRFHKGATKYSTLRQEYASEGYKTFSHEYWAFSRTPLTHSLLVISDPELEGTARRLFSCILIFSGLLEEEQDEWNASYGTVSGGQRDLIQMAQWIVECGMRRDTLLNELFLQLIKQTTDHPEPNSRANVRHWQLLALLGSLVLPTQKHVLHYLHAHLKHCAMDVVTEEGQFAQFALKCLMRTMETRGRKWPPSRDEVSCTTRRHPCRTRIQFLDGQLQQVDFDPCTSAHEVVTVVKKRLNLRPDAEGYALYEVIGTTERAMAPAEKLGDALSKWERWTTLQQLQQQQQQAKKEAAAAAAGAGVTVVTGSDGGANEFNNNASISKDELKPQKQQIFLFKKHLVIDSMLNLAHPVEQELIFHQLVYSVRLDRFPINAQEAVMLCSLRAQLDYGDFRGDATVDYRKVMAQCLPMRLLKQLSADAVMAQHQILAGMSAPQSKAAFLALLRSWPLWGSSIFEVQQSTTCSWPKLLWLAVDQTGLHLLEIRTRNVLCTCDYEHIVNYSPSLTSIIIFTQSQPQRQSDPTADAMHGVGGNSGHNQSGQTRHKGAKYIFNTNQALQIAQLIKDYVNALQLKRKPRECKRAITTTLDNGDRWAGTYVYGKGMYPDII